MSFLANVEDKVFQPILIMSHHIFKEINRHLVLRNDESPSKYLDKFWWIYKLIVEWDKNMELTFSPCCLVCVDEYIVVFFNPHALAWV